MDDDYSDDEEAAVYLGEEVPSDNESFDSQDIDDDSGIENEIITRSRGRVRGCTPGCECERPRGRKCECEKRSLGLCGVHCKCDRSKCRTTVKDSDDD